MLILLITTFLVIEAYDAAERSMVRLNKTGAELMHKYGMFSAVKLLSFVTCYTSFY